jgi:hypothetical protein
MAVLVACPQCAVTLDVPESLLGQKVRCATCSTVFEARRQELSPPGADAPPAPTEPERGIEDTDRHERRSRRWGSDDADADDYDLDDPRRRRRDLEPHRGGTVLTFGILSICLGLLICALLGIGLGIPAITMGRTDLRKIREGTMDADGAGQTQVGLILGCVGLGLGILQLLACGAYFLFIAVMMGSGKMK